VQFHWKPFELVKLNIHQSKGVSIWTAQKVSVKTNSGSKLEILGWRCCTRREAIASTGG